MLPNLTIIIACYVIVRLITVILRQMPVVEKHPFARYQVGALAFVAILLVIACTLDTIGVGVSIGSTIDARHGH